MGWVFRPSPPGLRLTGWKSTGGSSRRGGLRLGGGGPGGWCRCFGRCRVRSDNPVPAARRSTGLRPKARGLLGHIAPRRPATGGRLVRQPQHLPESLDHGEVAAFIADLNTARDRAMTLAMLVGGLRAAEV